MSGIASGEYALELQLEKIEKVNKCTLYDLIVMLSRSTYVVGALCHAGSCVRFWIGKPRSDRF